MAKHHRVFVAFAIEDKWARDRLVGQAANQRTPFEWTDMSVKQPWETDWESRVTTRIKSCDGLLIFATRNTAKATGALFELRTAKQVLIPVMGMYATQDNRPTSLPSEFAGVRVVDWTWPNISAFLNRL